MTEVRTYCPGCNKRLKTIDALVAGQRLRCPRCTLSFTVRDEDIRPANGEISESLPTSQPERSPISYSSMALPIPAPSVAMPPISGPDWQTGLPQTLLPGAMSATSLAVSSPPKPPAAPPPPPIPAVPRPIVAGGKGSTLLVVALGMLLLLGGGLVAILVANSQSNDDDAKGEGEGEKGGGSVVVADRDKKPADKKTVAEDPNKDRKPGDKAKDSEPAKDSRKPAPPPNPPAPPKPEDKKPATDKPSDKPKPIERPDPPPMPEPVRPIAVAQVSQLSAETQKQVDSAVERGVKFLKKLQHAEGHWGNTPYGSLGSASLPALTLLECGVPASDPVIAKAAAYVRKYGAAERGTYHLSLGILFLDRLGEPKDRRLIQKMALRLMAGQRPSGGWSYSCDANLSDQEEYAIFQALEHTRPTSPQQLFASDRGDRAMEFFITPRALEGIAPDPGSVQTGNVTTKPPRETTPTTTPADKTPEKPAPPKISDMEYANVPLDLLPRKKMGLNDVPPRLKELPVLRPLPAAKDLHGDGTDNSNTQFGILGIWAAGRHGVPTERALALLVKRFRRSQATDGSWDYHFRTDGHPQNRPAMNCAGLLGLAVGHGVVVSTGGQPKGIEQDDGLKKGLLALSRHIEGVPGIKRPKQRPKFVGAVDYYFLWSLERVGVLFNLSEIGGKEWYPWGVDVIVDRQNQDGSWSSAWPHAQADTCFALLFLKRTNLARDLSRQLEVIAESKEPKKD